MENQEITTLETEAVAIQPQKVKSEKKTSKPSIKLSKKNEEMISQGLKKYIKKIQSELKAISGIKIPEHEIQAIIKGFLDQ